jgi:pimeloyl-ACP methyl ester carboxylesterase
VVGLGRLLTRWNSGDDDYFSSDLPDEKVKEIWGRVRKPMLIMPSGEDQHVPAEVDVKGMVQRWKGFCRDGVVSELSGLIPGADHSVRDAKAQEWMIERVVKFLEELGR